MRVCVLTEEMANSNEENMYHYGKLVDGDL